MQTQHTPGPWAVDEHHECDIQCGELEILSCFYDGMNTEWEVLGKFPPVEEAVANAKLIAAAPELLKALQAFRELMPKIMGYGQNPWIEEAFRITVQAETAIMKATGESVS